MLDWGAVDTVLLDMDGTLLDLHYDNHFWLDFIPGRYAQRHGLEPGEARRRLVERYDRVAGTMQWYCMDYWSRELELDIEQLKQEVAHLIAIRPGVERFLQAVRDSGRPCLLVTNAHRKSLKLKMQRTGLEPWFDALVCAHDYGYPKEHPSFWTRLQAEHPFDPQRTLLIDDSVSILRAARDYGIVHLRAIRRPDSRQAERDFDGFAALDEFAESVPLRSPAKG